MGDKIITFRQKLKPSKMYRLFVLFNVTLGIFMINVDMTAISVALPTLKQEFAAGTSILQWVVTIYFLVITGLLPTTGKLSDLVGRKRIYLTGLSFFMFGSLLCSIATSIEQLILFRGIQGIGGSMIMGIGMGIIVNTFPKDERGRSFAALSSAVAVATIVGPIIGGFVISAWSWKAIFIGNMLTALFVILLAIILLDPMKPKSQEKRKLDIVGGMIFFVAVTFIVTFLSNGNTWGWLSLPSIGSFILGISLFTWFLTWEKKSSSPLVELELFRNASFAIGNISLFICFILMMFPSILLPLYLTEVLSYTPLEIGFLLTPQAIAMIIGSPIGGWITDRFGHEWPTIIGMSLCSVALFGLSTLQEASTYTMIVVWLGLFGLGLSLFLSPNNVSVMSHASQHNFGLVSSLMATIRNFGRSFGVALAILLLEVFQIVSTKAQGSVFASAVSNTFLVAAFLGLATMVLLVGRYRISRKQMGEEVKPINQAK